MKTLTPHIDTVKMAAVVDNLKQGYSFQRRNFERRNYENNFFDDGYHFRQMSRTTGKIVDVSQSNSMAGPIRAIPKASRQIRGIANLLMALEPHPSIYPEKITAANYTAYDRATGQQVLDQEKYAAALKHSKYIAQRIGHWVEEGWQDLSMRDKLGHMLLLTAKHGISYMQIWPDTNIQKINGSVYDFFDIYLAGQLDDIYHSPSIIKAIPTLIAEIKSNEMFDPVQREMISPDNKYASSEVKQAYMQSRFGNQEKVDGQETLILNEMFSKEYVTDENVERIKASDKKTNVLEGKSMGDIVMRQTFTTSNGWLRDEYIDLQEYPFVEYRMEPGMMYQVPLLDRLKDANKSLDVVMSRVEGFANTMAVGVYQKRKGENYKISNIPGGQVIEYEGMPLQQMQLTSMPAYIFNYIQALEQNIEEQGAATSALNQLPTGVKSGKAIESVKATEYANLKISTDRLKETVRHITQRMLELASKTFYEPMDVMGLDSGEPDYFSVIGEAGQKEMQKNNISFPEDTVVIKKDLKVRIEIESSMGYTMEGKKDTMAQLTQFIVQLAEKGVIPPQSAQIVVKKMLEVFQFGSTQEFMESLELPVDVQEAQGEQEIDRMKIAVLEALQDAGMIGPDKEEEDITKTKVGVMEAAQEMAQPGVEAQIGA